MRNEISILNFDQNIPLRFSIIHFDKIYPHMHSYSQLLIFLDGECELTIKDKTYIAKPDDMVIVNSGIFHKLSSTSSNEVTLLSVLIDQFSFAPEEKNMKNISFTLNSLEANENLKIDRYESIKYLVYSIIKYNSMENINSVYTNRAISYSLFAQLMNDFSLDNKESNKKDVNLNTITRLTSYINDHFRENLTLKSLSEAFNYSTSYISRIFGENLSKSFKEYYDEIRVNFAMNDIVNTNKSIEEIASDNGFDSARSFVRAFRSINNEYPSTLRKELKSKSDLKGIDLSKIKRDALFKIFSYYDNYNKRHNSSKEIVRYTEANIMLSYQDKTIKLHSPQTKLIDIDSAKNILKEETMYFLNECQHDIKFKNIILRDPFDEDYIPKDKNLNPVFLFFDKSIFYLQRFNLYPYFKIFIDIDDQNFLNFYDSFIYHLSSLYEKEDYQNILISFEIRDFSYVNDNKKNKYLKMISTLHKRTRSVMKNIKIGFVTFTREDYLKSRVDYTLSNLKNEGLEFDFYPISFLSASDKNLLTNKNELKDFLNYLKKKNYFIDNKIFIEDFNFTTSNSLLNDTLFSSCFLAKNLIDNIKSLGAIAKYKILDSYDLSTYENNPFTGKNGMLTYNNILKSSYNAHVLFSKLGDELLKKSANYIITKKDDKHLVILLTNYSHYSDLFANSEYFELTNDDRYQCFPKSTTINFKFEIKDVRYNEAKLRTSSINKNYSSAYDIWVKNGHEENLTNVEISSLRKESAISYHFERKNISYNTLSFDVSLDPLEIKLIEIELK